MAEQVRKRKRRRRRSKSLQKSINGTRFDLERSGMVALPVEDSPEEKIRFVRLDAKSPDFPLLWLQFAARARKGWERGAPYMPMDAALANWKEFVQQAPDVLPVWLLLDGELVVGHLVAQAEFYHGQPFISVHQLVVDRHDVTRALKTKVMAAFLAWIENLNAMLVKTQGKDYPQRFTAIRFLTPHSSKFWRRWLPNFELAFEERSLFFKVPELNSET